MNANETPKKFKKPKRKTNNTTNPESPLANKCETPPKGTLKPSCPLLAKDSEWVEGPTISRAESPKTSENSVIAEEEEVLQLVECEDGPELKPLAIMFPGLLEKDPQTLQAAMSKAMSTTDVTRTLVDLGQKANFTFMKQSNRLIPKDKQWLESVAENSNSYCSVDTPKSFQNLSRDYEASSESEDFEELQQNMGMKTLTKPLPFSIHCSKSGGLQAEANLIIQEVIATLNEPGTGAATGEDNTIHT